MKPTQVPWVEIDGSIYTASTVEMRSEFSPNRTVYQVPVAIAFNVGKDVARHIVETHNARIAWEHANPVRHYVDGSEIGDTNRGSN